MDLDLACKLSILICERIENGNLIRVDVKCRETNEKLIICSNYCFYQVNYQREDEVVAAKLNGQAN